MTPERQQRYIQGLLVLALLVGAALGILFAVSFL